LELAAKLADLNRKTKRVKPKLLIIDFFIAALNTERKPGEHSITDKLNIAYSFLFGKGNLFYFPTTFIPYYKKRPNGVSCGGFSAVIFEASGFSV